MPPPRKLKQASRIFARLPGTGWDRTLPPVCCDLSKIACVPPATLLPKSAFIELTKPTQTKSVYGLCPGSTIKPSGAVKRPVEDEDVVVQPSSAQDQTMKKRKVVVSTLASGQNAE